MLLFPNVQGGDWILPPGTGPYLPAWQMSPAIPMPSLLNFNFFAYTDLAPMLNQTLKSGKATLSYLQTDHQGTHTEDLIRVFLSLNQYRHSVVNYNADPMTQVSYPVFDSFNPMERKVTGVVVTAIFWRLLFVDILPSNVKGVVCVLKNSLGERATYRMDGREALYIGNGDLHDPKYDDMVITRDISDYISERAKPETTSYTSIGLDVEYTSYEIHVYPSDDMRDTYITKEPILFAIVVVVIFCFTSMVFLIYDWMVERRQKKVMDTAVKSNAVVSSLFPQAVHDPLFAGNKEEEVDKSKKNAWLASVSEYPTRRGSMDKKISLADMMEEGDSGGGVFPSKGENKKARPIADKFGKRIDQQMAENSFADQAQLELTISLLSTFKSQLFRVFC